MKYSEKNEFIKEMWRDPTFKLWRGSWGLTFKLWRVSLGPTFKLWGRAQVPGPRIPSSWVPGYWSHFYTIRCVLFFNKAKPVIKPTSMWSTWENFRYFKPLCIRGSLMAQFTNFDIENNLQFIFTSSKCNLSTND